jgi:threonine/homoserine/homoserine lactone efflux protein
LIASLALIATPGPDVIYVVTRGVAQGVALLCVCSVLVGLGLRLALLERR